MPLDTGTILDAYDTLRDLARRSWIGGIPTDTDLKAIRKRVADRLSIDVAQVTEAIRQRGEIEEIVRG